MPFHYQNISITSMSKTMVMVIENAKQALDHSSAHSSIYNKQQTKFNNCLKFHAYSENVIIGFWKLIFLTFEKTAAKYESPPWHCSANYMKSTGPA